MKLHNCGMPTLIETSTLEEGAKLCAEFGLDFIELNMNLPQYQIPKIDIAYFKSIADKYGIYYTIHLDENLNISDFNPYVSEAYTKTVADTIEIAKQLDIKVLNMHMAKGVYFTLPDRKVLLFSEYKEQYLKSVIDFRDMWINKTGDGSLSWWSEHFLENHNHLFFIEGQKPIKNTMKRIGSQYVYQLLPPEVQVKNIFKCRKKVFI